MRLVAAALAAVIAGTAMADPLRQSPLPKPRPGSFSTQLASEPVVGEESGGRIVIIPVYYDATTRPRPRPGSAPTVRQLQPAVSAGSALARAQVPRRSLLSAPLPKARPDWARSRPERPVSPEPARVLSSGRIGPVCGARDIVGQVVDDIPGRLRGCGVEDPIRVVEVGGVKLSRAVTMDCRTATALRSWVEGGLKPIIGRTGGGPARIDVVAGYSCRTINSRPGGDISEHGKGKAIDVAGITLRNGTSIRVEDGWRRRPEGEVLRRLHRAACGPFGTVLGPEADRYHQDHLHFDTKARRSPYCR